MMGADSVAYHRETVLARGDDHPGQALAYYASRDGDAPAVGRRLRSPAWPGGSGDRRHATARHATSRAGDPCPHDHVLVANVVRMDDAKGGWKGADMASSRPITVGLGVLRTEPPSRRDPNDRARS